MRGGNGRHALSLKLGLVARLTLTIALAMALVIFPGGGSVSLLGSAWADDEFSEPAEGGETDFVLGDVNFDGDINVTDLTLTAAHVKSIRALSEKAQLPADVNKDGDINVTDLAKLAAHVKGIRALR